MSVFRIFAVLYVLILAALFNSKWADESMDNVPRVRQTTKQNGVNFLSDSYMNVKAVQVNNESIKVFAILDESFNFNIKLFFKTTLKYYYSVNAIAKFCAIRSYLHLLQKF